MGFNKEQLEAEALGGTDMDRDIAEKRGCEKLHHFLRSLYWQPNHKKYIKEFGGQDELRNGQQNSNRRQGDNGESPNA